MKDVGGAGFAGSAPPFLGRGGKVMMFTYSKGKVTRVYEMVLMMFKWQMVGSINGTTVKSFNIQSALRRRSKSPDGRPKTPRL